MAQSLALYRKWRPLTFSSVIGQAHVTSVLQSQVKQSRTSHAYLFTGTRGTGKTTCAKILARAVCCEHPIDGEPCNECSSCRAILEDSCSDFSEIDAASNTGVDNIRAIREEALYMPTMLSRRIFIIDEVHMLSANAFNALLKIMEEPPAHVLFILATTDVHKIPATILSRCQRFDFRRVAVSDIADRLMYIASQEGYSLTREGAELIARLGDGSVRDSITLYDRCMPYSGTVDELRVTDSLGLPDQDSVISIFSCIADKDSAGALSGFLDLYNGGKDIISFFDSLLSLIRDIYVVKLTNRPEFLSVNSIDAVKELSDKVGIGDLEFYISCVSDLLQRLTRTSARRADGEVCIMKMTAGRSLSSVPAESAQTAEKAALPKKTAEKPSPQAAIPDKSAAAHFSAPSISQPISAPQQIKKTEPEPKRSEAVGGDPLKKTFINMIAQKVSPSVRTFIGFSNIIGADKRLIIEAPEESLMFMTKGNYTEIFKEAAMSLGFSDVAVIKKPAEPPPPSPIETILNNAKNLGIPIERK